MKRSLSTTHSRRPNPQMAKFLKRTAAILGVSESEVKRLLVNHPFKAFRINSLKLSGTKLNLLSNIAKLGVPTHQISWYEDAYIFDAEDTAKLQASDMAQSGQIYIQNPSSYLPVIVLDPQPNEDIIDICAAPGGKASMIASLVGNADKLVVNEPKPDRASKLGEVLSMQGADNAYLIQEDGRHLPQLIEQRFDKVLIDAECSTEAGTNFLSKDPLKGWSEERILGLNILQKQLITAGYDLLKPGGVLVYSTCTFAPEENEEIIASLIERRPDAIVQPIKFTSERAAKRIHSWNSKKIPLAVSDSVLRIFPSDYMEGFFVARIRKPLEFAPVGTAAPSTPFVIKS